MTASIVAIGNPGVGKSTILNALAGEHLFRSGISVGSGMTYQLDEKTNSRGRFFDTPGLADDTHREAAGVAIRDALRKGGPFKVLFFIMTEAGRVVKQDVTTMRLVLDACPELGNSYGIVINKIPPAVGGRLKNSENAGKFLMSLYAGINEDRRSPLSNITFVMRVAELDSVDDKVVPLELLQTLEGNFDDFISSQVPIVQLTPDKASDLKVEDFEKTNAQMEETVRLMEEKMKEDRLAWQEEQKRFNSQLKKAEEEKARQRIEDKRRHEEQMKKIQDQMKKAEEEKEKQRIEDRRRHEEQMKKLQDQLAGAGHFYIWGAESGKVLDASVAEPGRVYIHDFHGGHNQQWIWNGDTLRNRRFPDKVLDFHWSDYNKHGWGKVYLHEFNGGANQRLEIQGREIACKHKNNLRLDVHWGHRHNGAEVGVQKRNGSASQTFDVKMI